MVTGGHGGVTCVVAGGHAWLRGDVHGCGGCAWLWGACIVGGEGGMHGCREGACMVAGGHAWLWGDMCGICRDTVNERAVRILLECILILNIFWEGAVTIGD